MARSTFDVTVSSATFQLLCTYGFILRECQRGSMAAWSSGMIRLLGGPGPEIDSCGGPPSAFYFIRKILRLEEKFQLGNMMQQNVPDISMLRPVAAIDWIRIHFYEMFHFTVVTAHCWFQFQYYWSWTQHSSVEPSSTICNSIYVCVHICIWTSQGVVDDPFKTLKRASHCTYYVYRTSPQHDIFVCPYTEIASYLDSYKASFNPKTTNGHIHCKRWLPQEALLDLIKAGTVQLLCDTRAFSQWVTTGQIMSSMAL